MPLEMMEQVGIWLKSSFQDNLTGLKLPLMIPRLHFMIVEPKGVVAKRCLYSAQGLIAMTWPDQKLTFIKSVDVKRHGNYQMDGCNTALLVGQDNFMVEMETYGEEQSIYPGETIHHKEVWLLKEKVIDFVI